MAACGSVFMKTLEELLRGKPKTNEIRNPSPYACAFIGRFCYLFSHPNHKSCDSLLSFARDVGYSTNQCLYQMFEHTIAMMFVRLAAIVLTTSYLTRDNFARPHPFPSPHTE
jgi:hypothetical protein